MKSASEFAKIYAVVTQGFISMLVIGGIGYFIGYKIDKESIWPVVLAIIGILLGLIYLIVLLLKLKIGGDKNGRDT